LVVTESGGATPDLMLLRLPSDQLIERAWAGALLLLVMVAGNARSDRQRSCWLSIATAGFVT
jgi:hypothetical protein